MVTYYTNLKKIMIFSSPETELAHLSRMLTRLAYSIPVESVSVRQSVCMCVHIPAEPASVHQSVCMCVHTFKHEYLRNQQAEFNQILSEASFG